MAYELRISDGSSDVGSSDLGVERLAVGGRIHQAALVALPLHLDKGIAEPAQQGDAGRLVAHIGARPADGGDDAPTDHRSAARLQPTSEARRVGEECVRTARSQWSPYHKKKHIKIIKL